MTGGNLSFCVTQPVSSPPFKSRASGHCGQTQSLWTTQDQSPTVFQKGKVWKSGWRAGLILSLFFPFSDVFVHVKGRARERGTRRERTFSLPVHSTDGCNAMAPARLAGLHLPCKWLCPPEPLLLYSLLLTVSTVRSLKSTWIVAPRRQVWLPRDHVKRNT